MSKMHDGGYYANCMVGGALACGLTHAAVVSLDVAKCRAQVRPRVPPISAVFAVRLHRTLRVFQIGASPACARLVLPLGLGSLIYQFCNAHEALGVGWPRDA